jgi:voltage-gated potassium channel
MPLHDPDPPLSQRGRAARGSGEVEPEAEELLAHASLGCESSRMLLKPGSRFRRRLVTYLVVAGFIVLLAGGGFAAFESRQVSSYWEGLWWALSLMSTVGFIGEAPESTVGRLVSSVLMISGFALMALVTASIASLFVREEQEPDEAAEQLFDAQALRLLADIAQRLEAIEAKMIPDSPEVPGMVGEPPSDTSV